VSLNTRSRIIGTGGYKAENVLTNLDLENLDSIDTNDQWIVERTGIKERRVAPSSVQTSDMAVGALKEAIEMAGIQPNDLDMIICGTVTGDMPLPATAAFVQKKIGATNNCPAFDISAACAGFIYGLSIADSCIRNGQAKTVAVIGTEMLTRFLDWTDRNTCVLFGDGAGAVILQAETEQDRGILSTHLFTDSAFTDILQIPGGGSKQPPTADTIASKAHCIQMEGREVYRVAVRYLSEAAELALEANGFSGPDVNIVTAHQANIRILQSVAKKVRIPIENFALNIDKYGNTSSASIPISLNEAVRAGRVKENDLMLMIALGGGISYGSALIRW
jgi:3-oxoacyl-[acyl-carrier-protein] synthase-3